MALLFVSRIHPSAWGQSDAPKPNSAKAAGSGANGSAVGEEAAVVLSNAHQQLASRRSVRADLLEIATLTEPPLRMSGKYVSAGLKLRIDYHVQLPGGVGGSLLEVCDGERLWSYMQLPGSQHVTRRDVRQILAAVERARPSPESAAAVDLALGGLPALLSSLQRSMKFDAVKEDVFDERPVLVLIGQWNEDLARQLGGDPKSPQFPPHIPEGVRLTLDKETRFPVRLVYLRRQETGLKALLDMRFRNVVLDGPVDDDEFVFTPPDAAEPEDVTRQYLDQLFPAEKSSETGEKKSAAP